MFDLFLIGFGIWCVGYPFVEFITWMAKHGLTIDEWIYSMPLQKLLNYQRRIPFGLVSIILATYRMLALHQ